MPEVTLYLGVSAECGHTGVMTHPGKLANPRTASRGARSQSRHAAEAAINHTWRCSDPSFSWELGQPACLHPFRTPALTDHRAHSGKQNIWEPRVRLPAGLFWASPGGSLKQCRMFTPRMDSAAQRSGLGLHPQRKMCLRAELKPHRTQNWDCRPLASHLSEMPRSLLEAERNLDVSRGT